MSEYAVMPLSDYDNACDKIREKTETIEPIKSGEFASKVEDVYNCGYADGKSQGGGGLYDAELNNLLAVAPFLTKVQQLSYDNDYIYGQGGGLLVGYDGAFYRYVVIMPFVTEIGNYGLDNIQAPYGVEYENLAVPCVIFTSKTPPVIGRQALWSSNGGNSPPLAIFVPDASIDAYKAATNLAEFADRIKPLSQYNAEEYWGDWVW